MFKVKNKISYFGLEFDHDAVPNAVVMASSRPQKVIKWVNSYKPIVIDREDGKKVRRERTAVQCPMNFRLRSDEIHAAMKRNKTENYQDGKFFVVLDHRLGQFEHPDTVKMKQAELRKKVADEKSKSIKAGEGDQKDAGHPPTSPSEKVGDGAGDPPVVAVQAGASEDPVPVTSTTESGVEVTDRRRGAVDSDSKK